MVVILCFPLFRALLAQMGPVLVSTPIGSFTGDSAAAASGAASAPLPTLPISAPATPVLSATPASATAVTAAAAAPISGLALTLHGQRVNLSAQEMGTYRALSAAELADRELHVIDGNLAVGTDRRILDTSARNMMYVMHPDRRIYVGMRKRGFSIIRV